MTLPIRIDYHFVTDRLAVGGAIGTTENMHTIREAGFTHVVNLQDEFDDHGIAMGTGVTVLQNGCDDDLLPKASSLFWNGVRFTLQALADPDAKVLFHCSAGIHRSPMMLLAVLRVLGHERREAVLMITDVRPEAHFQPVYLMSVEDFVIEYQTDTEPD